MNTDSLYLDLAEENLEDCILSENKSQKLQICRNDCIDDLIANAKKNFFRRTSCAVYKKHDNPVYSKKNFNVLKCCACAVGRIADMIVKATNLNKAAKDSTKKTLEDTWDEPMPKYRRVLDEAVNIKSTNRGFKTSNHLVGTYEQTKKGLSYFYPTREVLYDGIHTKPLNF